MSSTDARRVALIGTGPMAVHYLHVLADLRTPVDVIGRSVDGCRRFEESTGVEARPGGIDDATELMAAASHVVVAVDLRSLAKVTKVVIEAGAKQVLVEKPGALDSADIDDLAQLASTTDSNVRIAYNRRYLASTDRARDLIEADGGVDCVFFDFTEWTDRVLAAGHPREVLERWFVANSTHVVDLATFLAGEIDEMTSLVDGSLDWHPSASRFAGVGRTKAGALVAYRSDWESGGRWAVEINTVRRRLILSPLEELWEQQRGSADLSLLDLDDHLDRQHKPGLHAQVADFLDTGATRLPTVAEQAHRLRGAFRIIGAGGTLHQ